MQEDNWQVNVKIYCNWNELFLEYFINIKLYSSPQSTSTCILCFAKFDAVTAHP